MYYASTACMGRSLLEATSAWHEKRHFASGKVMAFRPRRRRSTRTPGEMPPNHGPNRTCPLPVICQSIGSLDTLGIRPATSGRRPKWIEETNSQKSSLEGIAALRFAGTMAGLRGESEQPAEAHCPRAAATTGRRRHQNSQGPEEFLGVRRQRRPQAGTRPCHAI